MDAARKLATYDDLVTLGEVVKAEIIHGTLVTLPSVLPRHSNVQRVSVVSWVVRFTMMTGVVDRAVGGSFPKWT